MTWVLSSLSKAFMRRRYRLMHLDSAVLRVFPSSRGVWTATRPNSRASFANSGSAYWYFVLIVSGSMREPLGAQTTDFEPSAVVYDLDPHRDRQLRSIPFPFDDS